MTKLELIHMNIADIAKEVRLKLKREFPTCTFSVTIERFAGGQALDISLMSAPFEAFSSDKDTNSNPITKQYAQLNQYNFKDKEVSCGYVSNTYPLTPESRYCLKRAIEIANYYNFDESDPHTDYVNNNFYLHINIGKWDKGFKKSV